MAKKFLVLLIVMVLVNFFIYGQEKQEKKGDAESLFLKCKESLKAKDADKAIEFAEKAIAANNNVSKYYLYLGKASNLKINQVEGMEKMAYASKMKEAWEKALQLDGKNIEARTSLAMFYLQAPEFAGGSKEKAKLLIDEIVKAEPIKGHSLNSMIYLKEKNIEKALESAKLAFKLHHKFMKKNPKKESGFDPNTLNNLGYGLVNEKKMDEAIEIFKMNVKAFPKFYNPYDSLAEAYMKKGDKKLAIEFFKKALELNPNKSDGEKRTYNSSSENLKKLEEKITEI